MAKLAEICGMISDNDEDEHNDVQLGQFLPLFDVENLLSSVRYEILKHSPYLIRACAFVIYRSRMEKCWTGAGVIQSQTLKYQGLYKWSTDNLS